MTLEQLIAQVNDRGWLVSNLFQIGKKAWRCSLIDPVENDADPLANFVAYMQGKTAAEALAAAIALMPAAKPSLDETLIA